MTSSPSFLLSTLRDYSIMTTPLNPSNQPGTPDPDFGDQGTLTLHTLINDPEFVAVHLFKGIAGDSQGGTIFSAQMFRDDRYVYALGRMDERGELDMTFADRGLTFGNFVAKHSSAGGKLAVSQGGKIYMLGWSERADGWADLVVACFDHNGKPDPAFGQNGRVIIPTPPDLELHTDLSSIHVQPDNKLLISPSYTSLSVSKPAIGVLLRLMPDGSSDTGFSNNGRWEFTLPDHPKSATAIGACLSQGENIIIAGHVQFGAQKDDAVVARLSHDGQIDSSFGDRSLPGFHVVEAPGYATRFNALIERSDGSLVGAGGANMSGEQQTAGLLVALTPNGTPHQLFNNRKPLITRIDDTVDIVWVTALAMTENKFVVASGGRQSTSIYLASFLPDGQPDRNFNGKGYTDLDSESRDDPVVVTSGLGGRVVISANVLGLSPEGVGLARRFYG
ncbi:hypothetical protein [Pseudomonas sp.]|uniref:hypothetical protein n=1 Tax=Pseudomonas sp. TaxID=306 RepID=UPI0025891E98|nr:hypothetical protein [Pseudomonas sp.]